MGIPQAGRGIGYGGDVGPAGVHGRNPHCAGNRVRRHERGWDEALYRRRTGGHWRFYYGIIICATLCYTARPRACATSRCGVRPCRRMVANAFGGRNDPHRPRPIDGQEPQCDVSYAGTLDAGDLLSLDSARKTATLFDVSSGARTNALAAVTGDIPSLAPGRRRTATDRTQTMVWCGTAMAGMEIRYRRRYL